MRHNNELESCGRTKLALARIIIVAAYRMYLEQTFLSRLYGLKGCDNGTLAAARSELIRTALRFVQTYGRVRDGRPGHDDELPALDGDEEPDPR